MRELEAGVRLTLSWKFWLGCLLCIIIGVAALVIGFSGLRRLDTWLWLDLWFLIFGGLAQGILLWAAVFRVAQARWTPAISRLGHAGIAYLPFSYLAIAVLLAGAKHWVTWVAHPVPEKAAWLNLPFMTVRNLVCVLVLIGLNHLMVRCSLRADKKIARGERLSERDHYRLNAVSVAVIFAYVLVFTLISYDFVMSLSPEWFSTMFAPYYWITNAYASLGVLVIMSALLRRSLRVVKYTGPSQFSDLGNLMLGFSLFSMGCLFAQYLTIWMGNLPEETHFLIIRYYTGTLGVNWPILSWTGFFLGYTVPFVLLQSRALKRNPVALSLVSVLVLVGVVIERYVLVVPSVAPGKMWLDPVSGIGLLAFLGLFVVSVGVFLMRYPPVSAAQVALSKFEPKLEAITE